jgi:hypothetical protein
MKVLRRARRISKLVGLGLMVAAIAQEMAKPDNERTWTGMVLGFVPYDFRPPTWDRIRQTYWNAEEPRLLTTRVFGVGWGINFYRVRELLEGGFRQLMGTAQEHVPIHPMRASEPAASDGPEESPGAPRRQRSRPAAPAE